MGKSKILALAVATAMAFSSVTAQSGVAHVTPSATGNGTPAWFWAVFGCAGGIVFTAFVANWQQKRQLTAAEAATCGLLFYVTRPR